MNKKLKRVLSLSGKISFYMTLASFLGPFAWKSVLITHTVGKHIWKKKEHSIRTISYEKFKERGAK